MATTDLCFEMLLAKNAQKPAMEKAFRDWFDRNKDKRFSMATTETTDFCEGRAQLKWWKDRKTIIVKCIKLRKEHRGRGKFTAFVVKMLRWPDVETVELESILSDELIRKLLASSGPWKRKPGNTCSLIASTRDDDRQRIGWEDPQDWEAMCNFRAIDHRRGEFDN